MVELPRQEKKKKEFLSDFNYNKLLLVEKKKELIRFIKVFEIFRRASIFQEEKNQIKNENISPSKKNYQIKDFFQTLKKESILKIEMISSIPLLDIIFYFFFLQFVLVPFTMKI